MSGTTGAFVTAAGVEEGEGPLLLPAIVSGDDRPSDDTSDARCCDSSGGAEPPPLEGGTPSCIVMAREQW